MSQRGPTRTCLTVEELEPRLTPIVTYHNYGVIPNVVVQPVFYGAGWSTRANYPMIGQIDTFLGYLVNSSYMDQLTEAGYGVGRGSVRAPFGVKQNLGRTLTDGAITAYLSGVNRSVRPNVNRLYVVFVQPGVTVFASGQQEVGYHSYTRSGIHYAVVSYPGGNNQYAIPNDRDVFDNITGVASHEIAEAVTDPVPYAGWGGWYDSAYGVLAGEIGDLAAYRFIRLNGYAVQQVVDRNDQLMMPLGGLPLTDGQAPGLPGAAFT